MGVLLVFLAVLLVLLLLPWYRRYSRWRRMELAIPGPRSLPFLGNTLDMVGVSEACLLDKILQLWGGRRTELSRASFCTNLVVFVTDPDHIKENMAPQRRKRGVRKYVNFTEDQLKEALTDVTKFGKSARCAAKAHNIPHATLSRRLKLLQHPLKPQMEVGRPTVFTREEEANLCTCVLKCAQWGFPLMVIDIQLLVQSYLNKQGIKCTRFKNNCPGRDWVRGFLGRNPELTKRLCQNVKRARACVNRETIITYFDELAITLEAVSPCAIVNYDESGFSDDPGQQFVIVRRGTKHVERIMDSSRSSISVMFAGAGNGTLLPPYTVYKSKHMYQGWIEGGVEGSVYNRTESGWFDMNTFEDWFMKIALPYLRRQDGRRVLIGDNLASHVSPHVVSLCQQNNISFVLLPPNSTHICQPLDVAVFGPLKRSWKNVLSKLKGKGTLQKSDFPRLLRETLESCKENLNNNIVSGFRGAGIIPLNREKVLSKFPDKERESGPVWSECLVEHLAQTRASLQPSKPQTRSKRLNVAPGRGVTVADLPNLAEPPTKRKKAGSRIQNENVELLGEEEIEEDGLLQPTDNPDSVSDQATMSDHRPQNDTSIFKIGDFCLVSLAGVSRNVCYVGKIIEVESDLFLKFDFLRLMRGRKESYFTFPHIRDQQVILKDDIRLKLPFVNELRRGRLVFPDLDLTNVV